MGSTESKSTRTRPCTHCGRDCFKMEAGWIKCYHDNVCTKAICIICQREGKDSCMDLLVMAEPLPSLYFKPQVPKVSNLQNIESQLTVPIPSIEERPREPSYSSGWEIGSGGFRRWNSFPNY